VKTREGRWAVKSWHNIWRYCREARLEALERARALEALVRVAVSGIIREISKVSIPIIISPGISSESVGSVLLVWVAHAFDVISF
jgi:hypothetical protein